MLLKKRVLHARDRQVAAAVKRKQRTVVGFEEKRNGVQGPKRKLLGGLARLEAKVKELKSQEKLSQAVGFFFGAQGFTFPLILGFAFGKYKEFKSIKEIGRYVKKHKNHPRVAMFLAQKTSNKPLKRALINFAKQEIMVRKVVRSSKVSARAQINLLNGSSIKKSIEEAYRWGLKEGHIKKEKQWRERFA